MILMTIVSGGTTYNVVDVDSDLVDNHSGFTKDGVFYLPQLINPNSPNIEADSIERMQDGRFTLKVQGFALPLAREIQVSIKIWDEDQSNGVISIFTGLAIRTSGNRNELTYQIKTDKGALGADLLEAAPDIKPAGWVTTRIGWTADQYFNPLNPDNSYSTERLFPVTLGTLLYNPTFPMTVDQGGGTGEYYGWSC